jgi:ubiquinone/menaquinone biosynthesis C-methylase UbiE
MTTLSDNTYPIDPEHVGELARLMQQDRLLTEAMGGLLPKEGLSLPETGRVLDLACGPGGWALELAFHFPKAEMLGVDISAQVIEYARAQAWSRGLENVHFQVMNVMEPLAFPDGSFDLINGRLLCSFMLPSAWPRLLQDCFRLLRPGGVLRLTETEGPLTSSVATERYLHLIWRALQQAGQSFSPDGRHIGITPVLPRLVRQAGFMDVHLRASAIEWSMGTEAYYPVFSVRCSSRQHLCGVSCALTLALHCTHWPDVAADADALPCWRPARAASESGASRGDLVRLGHLAAADPRDRGRRESH